MVELLVVIAIIVVLAFLGFVGTSMAMSSARAAKDSSTMRKMWVAITLYSSDHSDYMPGPLFTRQSPMFSSPIKTNYREWRRLSDCLASYLGHEDPQNGDFIEGMAASWQKTPEERQAPAFYMQQKLLIGDGPSYENPWGKPAPAGYDERLPMKMAAVVAQPWVSRTWALTELDQLHPDITDPNLKQGCPEGMAHRTYRLALYFDGRVGRVDRNNKPF